jgi:GT2 family glycosyltransferase
MLNQTVIFDKIMQDCEQMQLSVIIVNYNVKHFLEQCLYSVRKAVTGMEAEVIVIDNNSNDNSVAYLQPKFPQVQFISNTENLGFSKACNQGLTKAKGKYILFLNPDTIVPEDCFRQCLHFFESHPDAGAVGVKMLDGSGNFLKESKRSFPSPATSLYKLFGLAKLFPRSTIFSKYHLGNLDENQDHTVDVLAGAFMMVSREVTDKTGGFDENFFMYGEDVDMSYRIQQAGYKNYYFAGSSIIHFKGESTRKGSLHYVRMFYQAMSIFVSKHYSSGKASRFNFLIRTAIWLRAIMTAAGNFVRKIGLPLLDAALLLLSFWLVKQAWSRYVRTDVEYNKQLLWISFPVFTVIYLVVAYYAGLYDRWYRRSGFIRSTLIATIFLLAGYSLLPEQYRFSRAIILIGALSAIVFISVWRWLLIKAGVLESFDEKEKYPATAIVSSPQEFHTVVNLMKEAGLHERVIGRIAVDEKDTSAIGHWKNITAISRNIPFRELIFCEGQLSFKNIIESIRYLPRGMKIKFHAAGSSSIVGSDSKDQPGETVSTENGFNLADPYNRRLKRLFDLIVSVVGLLTFPVHFFFMKRPLNFLVNCFTVLFFKKTWVGYLMYEKKLPPLRKSVLSCHGSPASSIPTLSEENIHLLDYWYAKDYEPTTDFKIVWKNYRKLGG